MPQLIFSSRSRPRQALQCVSHVGAPLAGARPVVRASLHYRARGRRKRRPYSPPTSLKGYQALAVWLEFILSSCQIRIPVDLHKTSSVAGPCEIRRVANRDEGEAVSSFLLQPGLFGTPLTPGERDEFSTRPVASIGRPDDAYWFARDNTRTIHAVIGVRMNVERTGIYEVSALAIHAARRRQGLGRRLLQLALRFVADSGGRGLLFETSSDLSYAPMHHLLADLGFKQVGCFPDFYYPGENTLWYYRPVGR